MPVSTDLVGRGLVDSATHLDVESAFDSITDPSPDLDVGIDSVDATAPEISAGFTINEVAIAKNLLGKPLTEGQAKVFGDVWASVRENQENKILLTSYDVARSLYGRQRVRFWTAVVKNSEAKGLIEEMGFGFSGKAGTAPFKILPNGTRITITLDHIAEVQSSTSLALDAANLRFSFGRENSVVLRLLHDKDPFLQ